jgi:hypothetical protein
MRDTTLIRRAIVAGMTHPFSESVFTNKYATCRTVKCYLRDLKSTTATTKAILKAVPGAVVKVTAAKAGRFGWVTPGTMIVRVPLTY